MRIPRASLVVVLFGVACSASSGRDDDDGPIARRILPPISDWPFPDQDASFDDAIDGDQNESPPAPADAAAPGIPIGPIAEEEDAAASAPPDGGDIGLPPDDGGCADAGEGDGEAADPDAGCAEPGDP